MDGALLFMLTGAYPPPSLSDTSATSSPSLKLKRTQHLFCPSTTIFTVQQARTSHRSKRHRLTQKIGKQAGPAFSSATGTKQISDLIFDTTYPSKPSKRGKGIKHSTFWDWAGEGILGT